jgi:hypothetical protein
MYSGQPILSNALIVIYSGLIFWMLGYLNSDEYSRDLLMSIWDKFVWTSIISAPMAFILFNFIGRAGYQEVRLGNYDSFNTFFNPVLGVISTKNLAFLNVGRVSWFMSEPSYSGFLQGLNIFWFLKRKHLISKRKYKWGLGLSILALLFTISMGSWVSLIVAIVMYAFYKLFLFFIDSDNISYRSIYFFLTIVFVTLVFAIIFIDYVKIGYYFIMEVINNLDKYSSLDDRASRIENSLKLIRNMNFFEFLFGYGPGTIETIYNSGESNGWLKSLIEVGFLPTFLYLMLIFRFVLVNKRNFLLFLFIAVSFNTIIIQYTPMIVVYIVILYAIEKRKAQPKTEDNIRVYE